MMITRKGFLKTTAISVLALAGEKLLTGFAGIRPSAASAFPKALTAIRWGMAVDLDRCAQKEGCTVCLDACRSAHNVPKLINRSHRIEWIWTASFESAFPSEQHAYQPPALLRNQVPLFCNHCDNPPCVRVCPTKATWKREDGIVMMDWHRCIGCRYCMAACPYGSRSFNWMDPKPFIARQNPDFPMRTKGVVEKCNFCEERLARGELPACVKACPQEALHFGDLGNSSSPLRHLLQSHRTIRRKPELGTEPEVFYIV